MYAPSRLGIWIAELGRDGQCGHVALAAVLGISIRAAKKLMPVSEVKPSSWREALTRGKKKWSDIGVNCPAPGAYGLVALRFEGSDKGHAVAVWNDGLKIMAFDNNSKRWLTIGDWQRDILPEIQPGRMCSIRSVIEVR
jgi:hypothetical protein